MKILIDSADIKAIKELAGDFNVSGVTTNPTILSLAGKNPYSVLGEIIPLIPEGDIHIQTVSSDRDGICEEAITIARRMNELKRSFGAKVNVFIKIPVTRSGASAIKELVRNGIECTGTAVYTLEQAHMAAESGAAWIAPYVNRIETLGENGIEKVIEMRKMFLNCGYRTKIVGASFKRVSQVTSLAVAGIDACTIPPALLSSMLDNENTENAILSFRRDFERLCGTGKTMGNIDF